jgi:hypothetical protein
MKTYGETVRELNDLARTAMGVAGRLRQTEGIEALPLATQSAIRERVETFSDFTQDNDPYGSTTSAPSTMRGCGSSRLAVTLKKAGRLSPRQQHDIAKKAAKRLLEAIPRRMPKGDLVRALLDRIGEMSVAETYRPTAPYAPGVNAFAISMADLRHLTSSRAKRDAAEDALREVLTTAVWNNLLQVKLEYPCKGKLWAVFYLNRLLCAHYNLPLNYGGFREKKLTEVKSWLGAQRPPLQLGLGSTPSNGETANQ